MNIVIEEFDISKTLISKVSLKTSPSMPSYGNDNIFFDYENKILYFGEAKFYTDTINALTEAFNSISLHSKNLQELSYIKNHTNTFIAENGKTLKKLERRLEKINSSQIKCTSITFIMSDDNFEEDADKNKYINNAIIVFLPIISKNNFLKYFENKVKTL